MEVKLTHKSKIIVIDNYLRHSQLKREMVDRLGMMPDVQGKVTNVKATMSEWSITSPEMERLKEFILTKTPLLYPWIVNHQIEFTAWWASVYRKGEYAAPHDHLFCAVSTIYFLKSEWYHSPLVFNDSRKRIKPVEGRLVLFPSYLTHSVPKHKHKETRITLAGNISPEVT